jgi:uncharacterized membrane protein YgcG
MKTTFAVLALTCLAIGVVPAHAQTQRVDGRWTPWLGCWRLLQEGVRADVIPNSKSMGRPVGSGPAVTVCVQPSKTTRGVTMTTFADGKQVLEQTIEADGAPHPITESGCTGTQTSDWSRDGLRLFTRVEIACSERPSQTISGLTLIAKGPAWIDIQSTSGNDQEVRIRRFTPTIEKPEGVAGLPPDISARAIADAQAVSRRALSVEDVVEASRKTAPNVIEAAIVETEARFNLNSRVLMDLSSANVSPNVIDLMVAQSFPSHFQVERPMTTAPRPVASAIGGGTSIVVGPGGYPVTQSPYTNWMYDPYYYYSYYYSPFAYPYYWGPAYFRSPTYFINNTGGGSIFVPNDSSAGTSISSSDRERGQVVNGRGYTRVHPTSNSGSEDPAQHTVSSPRTVRSSGSSGGDASSSSPSSGSSSSSGSSNGGSVSSGGYSNGGGGESTGRTAQPR